MGPVAKPMNKAQASNPKRVRSVLRKKAPVSIKRRAPEATASWIFARLAPGMMCIWGRNGSGQRL